MYLFSGRLNQEGVERYVYKGYVTGCDTVPQNMIAQLIAVRRLSATEPIFLRGYFMTRVQRLVEKQNIEVIKGGASTGFTKGYRFNSEACECSSTAPWNSSWESCDAGDEEVAECAAMASWTCAVWSRLGMPALLMLCFASDRGNAPYFFPCTLMPSLEPSWLPYRG